MNKPATRGRKRKKRSTGCSSLDEMSPSVSPTENEFSLLPSGAQEEQQGETNSQEESLSHVNKRTRNDNETEESTSLTENNTNSEPANEEPHSEETAADREPISVESPTESHSPDDVTIIGDMRVARPEVIDLDKLPTIRRGGSVVVDLTNDSGYHHSNVVDLTRDSSTDSSIDSSPVIVCVNRIYRGDPAMELPSCRFSHSGVLGRTLSDTDDDILEVAESNEANEENTSGIEASTSNSEDPAGKVPSKKICCPICLDDEETIKRRKRRLMSTNCGHVFCDKCIRSAVQMQSKCPTCRKKLTLRQFHPIFL
ncbi:E3 ubiquitin-protein ligase RNF4 [Pocillopora verrucosa]|uniref:RING-type domain-containing protein n=1 Tax=Pocillopora meandrina TaxID=46732 RepID=A0AAU9WR54_9CNID|nr:E3 ubiquitin-protein ligase RNF4-like [Pocillopora verrucosa]CAH3122706.1 unnamed protein product [Pocillopora meandrina]